MNSLTSNQKILFFDGDCHFCKGSVRFVLDHNKNGEIYFSSIQGHTYQELNMNDKPNTSELLALDGTIVYYSNHTLMTRSTAVIQVLSDLGGLWRLSKILLLVPRPFRDMIYTWIAKNRKKISLFKDHCQLPTPEESKRFLP